MCAYYGLAFSYAMFSAPTFCVRAHLVYIRSDRAAPHTHCNIATWTLMSDDVRARVRVSPNATDIRCATYGFCLFVVMVADPLHISRGERNHPKTFRISKCHRKVSRTYAISDDILTHTSSLSLALYVVGAAKEHATTVVASTVLSHKFVQEMYNCNCGGVKMRYRKWHLQPATARATAIDLSTTLFRLRMRCAI